MPRSAQRWHVPAPSWPQKSKAGRPPALAAWESTQEIALQQGLPSTDAVDAAYVRVGYKPYKRPEGLLRRIKNKNGANPKRAIGRRVSRYGLGPADQRTYDEFVAMVARFEKSTMVDFVEDALKDASERRTLREKR